MTRAPSRKWSRDDVPQEEAYDAVVVGGGLSGVAAARTLAASGRRVALLETTGALGREIVRAGSRFARLDAYAPFSPTIREFADGLRERGGLFDGGEWDPVAAAVVFDDLLERRGVTVRFLTWPSRLLVDGRKVVGVEHASGAGRAAWLAPRVIDASAQGKLARAWFAETPVRRPPFSMIHIIYTSVKGECPDRTTIRPSAAAEPLTVSCRPTGRPEERRVTLAANARRTRAEWLLTLDAALPALLERIPALRSGLLAHLADDAAAAPAYEISTGSDDRSVAGYVWAAEGAPATPLPPEPSVPIHTGMFCRPDALEGFFLAGPWLRGCPWDLRDEETGIANGFRIGEIVGAEAARR